MLVNVCLWRSLVWSDEIWVNKHIVMRHSVWNVFRGSHGSPPLLVFKHWSVGSCVNRAPPQSGSFRSPLHLPADGTILIAGCGSSAGQRGSTTRSKNGHAESMTWDWLKKERLFFVWRKTKHRGDALKTERSFTIGGWDLKAGVNESVKSARGTAQDRDRGDSSGWK